jgi:hypothetical protein
MYDTVRDGRRNKTEWYLSNRSEFMLQIDTEISKAVIKHKDKAIVTIRLNGTSDIRFEKIKVRNGKNIFELYPDVQFYDYTKNPLRFKGDLPKNYHLTFSRSEINDKDALAILKKGYNVAVVFKGDLPNEYMGYKVINGDDTDLRFTDPKNVIVGLKFKNITGKNGGEINKYAKESGFVVAV